MERTEAPAAAAARMEAVKVQQEGLDRRQTEQQEALDRRHKERQAITAELDAKARRMNARGAANQAAAAVHAGDENRMLAAAEVRRVDSGGVVGAPLSRPSKGGVAFCRSRCPES